MNAGPMAGIKLSPVEARLNEKPLGTDFIRGSNDK
jgi:hypothetical protein